MATESEPDPFEAVDYESTPLERTEYIAALVHLYRGELYRANSWRLRLDNTTNWAVLTTAGLLTFSFGEAAHSHWVLLIGLALVSVFLGFEARRYRFSDVSRARVRMIEENFYGPILRRDPVSPERGWGDLVASDLFSPHFKVTRFAALRARLARNYWAIYAVILLAWVVKLVIHPTASEGWGDVREHLSMGFLPWWVPLAYVVGFLAAAGALLLFGPRAQGGPDAWRDTGTLRGVDL